MVRPPRGSSRGVKYIVDQAEASESAGTQTFTMAQGADNDTLGQTSSTDFVVPVGTKIKVFDIRGVFGNLVAINDFVYWSIQRRMTGQTTIAPNASGGNPLRKNILLSGLFMIGKDQNKTLHLRYKVPKKFWTVQDGQTWQFTYNLGQITTTALQVVYKVFT